MSVESTIMCRSLKPATAFIKIRRLVSWHIHCVWELRRSSVSKEYNAIFS